MKRLNTAYFYRLADSLSPLRALEANTPLFTDNFLKLNGARLELQGFITNDLIPPVTSFGNCSTLLSRLSLICEEDYKPDRQLEWYEVNSIREALSHFEISLQADFGTRDTFIVSPKSVYSTTLLAERGQTIVSESCLALVPQMEKDLAAGCRCLVFELPTASAFHLFRAVEAMVKAYGEFVRSKPFSRSEQNGGLGSYANCLKQTDLRVDKRIINSIEQIASLHRNPTMHPEMHISTTEIMPTMGMVASLIETLGLDWKRRVETPHIPLLEMLPDDSKMPPPLEDQNENAGDQHRKSKGARPSKQTVPPA